MLLLGEKIRFLFTFLSLIRNFAINREVTPIRKNSNKIWFFSHLFVIL